MKGNLYYKKYIEKLINANPATITIKRKIITDDGFGGKKEETIELEPQTIRIYNKKAQREIVSDTGTIMSYNLSSVLKLLAKGGTDSQEGDTFTWQGKTLKVAFINDYFSICKQGELEVIK